MLILRSKLRCSSFPNVLRVDGTTCQTWRRNSSRLHCHLIVDLVYCMKAPVHGFAITCMSMYKSSNDPLVNIKSLSPRRRHLCPFYPQHGRFLGVFFAFALCTFTFTRLVAPTLSHWTFITIEREKKKQSRLYSWAPGGIIVFPFTGASFKGFCCW